ncbi:MAG: VOC family protein [Deltaproteobacteria bacterium]|nr:VOC family protein [Deltaproteobacteria bacterium]MBW2396268.1 VOC family protein [Deltaproteobacteria bacterium]
MTHHSRSEDEALGKENKEFELRGVNHLALVCKDMARTVDFYANVLGMPLTKTLDLPAGMGQHFFFDIGNGDSLAFFWFPEAPDRAPGVASPAHNVGEGSITTAHGSMNHIAFDVAPEKMEVYRERLKAKGIDVTEIVNHDNSPMQISKEVTDDVFVRSMYFLDPDGVLLEFAAWTRELRADEAGHEPATAADKQRYLEEQQEFMARMRKDS